MSMKLQCKAFAFGCLLLCACAERSQEQKDDISPRTAKGTASVSMLQKKVALMKKVLEEQSGGQRPGEVGTIMSDLGDVTQTAKSPFSYVGCFKDNKHRDLTKRIGNGRGHTVASCGKEARQQGYIYFALQYNGKCFADNDYSTPASKYPKKPDSQCGGKCNGETAQTDVLRCGGQKRNAIYTMEAKSPFSYVGCFKDKIHRDLTKRIGNGRGHTVASCGKKARQQGYIYFALQSNGQCFADNDYSTPASKYPKKPDSQCGDKCKGERAQTDVLRCGGPWRNAIYKMEVHLWQIDFTAGTFIIDKAGLYVLQEDIVFEPETPHHFPPADSSKYTKTNGYWLGFFAAIAVAANDVVVDLNGHSIEMSQRFAAFQRFFSIIQLGSKPFLAQQGPPQFSQSETDPIIPLNTEIKNGILGRSSHMGIHGNNNVGLHIHNLVIKDFETGGIQLNGPADVKIEGVTIGPSLGAPGSANLVPALATLSQSIFLSHIAHEFGEEGPEAIALRRIVNDFIEDSITSKKTPGTESHFLTDDSVFAGLPDGSALYGILIHKSGPAIHDFAACTQSELEQLSGDPLMGVEIKDVVIKDLHLKSDEVVKTVIDGRPVLGPAGDVIQVLRLKDANGKYKGNALSDSQIKMMQDKLNAQNNGLNETELFLRYGSTNIPTKLLQWMTGEESFASATANANFICGGDAMSHHNKGVVGLRVEFVQGVKVSNIKMSGLHNYGLPSPHKAQHCEQSDDRYQGSDVWAMTTTLTDLDIDNLVGEVAVDVESCHSEEGQVHDTPVDKPPALQALQKGASFAATVDAAIAPA